MTGATITESQQKLTPETRLTHQKNPVRKGKKGEKNNNNKEGSPTKPQCLNTPQNPEQRLVTRKKILALFFYLKSVESTMKRGKGMEGKVKRERGRAKRTTTLTWCVQKRDSMTACGKIAPPQADVRPQPQETRTNAPTKPQQSRERQRGMKSKQKSKRGRGRRASSSSSFP